MMSVHVTMSYLISFAICVLVTRNLAIPFPKTIKRQSNDCHYSVRIRECNINGTEEEQTESLPLFRIKTNQLIANSKTDCKFDTIKYQWTINDEEHDEPIVEYETNNVFVIYPFALKKGVYGLSVIATLMRNGVPESSDFSACNVEMIALNPIAVIEGGSEKTVDAGHRFLVDGSKSIDRDAPAGETGNLVYKWKCQVLEGSVKDFCQKEYTGSTLTVPSAYAFKNTKYQFTLSVRNQDSNTWATSDQIVTILEDAAELGIVCEKNCPPAAPKTDSTRITFLRVKCLKHCSGIKVENFEWTFEEGFNYEQSTQFGRNTDKFIIKENVLKDGNYTVSVKMLDRKGTAKRRLEVLTPVKIQSCEVTPSDGVAIETKFTVKCTYTGLGYEFEVFTSKNEKRVILAKSYKLEFLEFVLPASVDTFVKITDKNGFQDVYKLNVNVKSASSDKVADFADSIKTLIERGDTDAAVQTTNAIIEEMERNPKDTKTIKEAILRNLQSVTMKSQDDARQISHAITRVVHDPKSDSDPFQAETATQLCKQASEIELEYLKKEYYPTILLDEVQENTKTLMMCGETDTRRNLEVLKPVPVDFNITTPFPVLEIPVIEEQYPDYDNDESVAVKTEKYELASRNLVGICENSLKMIALTVVEGEDTVAAKTETCSAQITRLEGKLLVEWKVKILGAAFWLSRDLEEDDDVVDLMVCSWQHDPFWWNPSKIKVATNVVLVKVAENGTNLEKFEEPNQIVLDYHSDDNKTIQQHDIELVDDSMIRVDVKKGENFFVDFPNLSQSLRVLISNFDKPDLEDIRRKGKEVTREDNLLFQEEVNGYDSWYYVSVFPPQKISISVYTKSCYSWSISDKKWNFACKGHVNSTKDQILCFCHHLSILAGVVYYNPIKIDQVTTKPDFEMVLLSCHTIFISVGAILALYCLILTITVPRKSVKSKTIYIPGDISTTSRYVYLVAIQTGRKRHSGTSSNICIRMYGDLNKSKRHVLNYPDPQKRIFERNNTDWFVVPTVYRLGDLTEVDLWSDFSGRSPRWFCTSVKIYDLQSDQEWYFKVNEWFDLPPRHQVGRKVQVCNDAKKKRSFDILWRIFPKRTHQDEFSRFTKTTLLLSIFLMIFLFCMVLYGPPRLRLSDGFAKIEKYDFRSEMIWFGLATAGVTFVLHMTLVWFFRNSGTGKKYSARVTQYCWVLLTTNVIISTIILIVFGFWVPPTNSWLWLTSVLIAIFVYFFILENIYEIWLNFHRVEETTKIKLNQKKMLLVPVEYHRTYLFRKFGENLLRPYFTHLYRHLDEDDIKERKLRAESRQKLMNLLEDTIMFFCYVTLLYLAIFANRNPMTVQNHLQMIDLVSGEHGRTDSFDDIRSTADIYHYINLTLIPTLHAQQWYHHYVVKEPGIMADFHNKLLGVARLRQKRVFTESSKNQTSRLEFWYSDQNIDSFGPEVNQKARLSHVWNYTVAQLAGLSVYVGKFGIYHGGGFVAPLGRTWFNSYANLIYLWNHTWIDSATSLVMIEFLAYNVNTNLFNGVRIILERSSTGYLRSKLDLSTAQFLFIKGEEIFIQGVIFFSFVLVVCIFSIKLASRVWKGRFLVLFKDLWVLVDLLIVGLSYSCFILFVHRSHSVKIFLDQIETMKKNEFINYFGLLHEYKTFTFVAAFLVFVATVRLWKACRYGAVFKIMEKTVFLSMPPILVVLLYHIVVLLAFALSGCFLFGNISRDFRDLPDTLISLMLLMLGLHNNFDFEAFLTVNPTLSRFYYTGYNLSSLFFLTIYVAVIMIYYYEAQVEVSGESHFDNVKKFLFKEFLFYRTYLRMTLMRLKGGASRKRRIFVTPKPDELFYAGCFTLPSNTLKLMSCIAIRELKETMTMQEKIDLMLRVLKYSSESDKVDIFFSEKTERKIEIFHENRVKKVAVAVELILGYNEKNRRRVEKRYKKIMAKQLRKFDSIKRKLNIVLNVLLGIEIE